MRRLLFALLCTPFIACGPPTGGGGGGGGGNGGGGITTLDAALDAYEDTLCTVFTTCNDTVQSSLIRQFFFEFGGDQLIHAYQNTSHCKALIGKNARNALIALIDAGRIDVDLTKAQACFDAMATECVLEIQPTACLEFLIPKQQLGDACGNDAECATTDCSAAAGQCGACITPAAIGETCSREIRCAEGGRCDDESSECVAQTPKVGTGQPCESDLSSIEGNCENPMDLCVDGVCTTYTLAQTGEACGDTGDKLCALGSICINDVCVSDAAAIGETCQVPDGEDQMKRSSLCPINARCDTLTSNCVALISAGESCSGDSQCTDGNYCSELVCTAKQAIDADCDTDSQCASDTCVDGVCAEQVAFACE